MMFDRLQRLLVGTVRRQLLIGMVLIVASMMSVFVWDLTQRQRALALEQQTERAVAIARSVAMAGAVWVASRDFGGLEEIIAGIAQYPDLRYAMVLDSNGQVMAHSDPARRGQYLTDLPPVAELKVLQRRVSLVDVASPVLMNSRPIGWVRIGLGGTLLEGRLVEIRRSGIFYTLLALALSVIFAVLASRHLTRRLDAITQVANAVQAGRTGLRTEVSGADEAARLAGQFNNMLDTLAQRDQALKESAQYEQSRSHILELLAADAPLRELLDSIVRGVEQLHPAMLCSIMLLAEDARHLGQSVAPSLPDFFNAAMDGVEIGSGVGSCGIAADRGERVIAADIATHPDWAADRELAARAGLAACWSQPIKASGGQVLGIFAIYHRQINRPTAQDIQVIEKAARLAAIAIEKQRTQAALKASEDTFRTLFETSPHGVVYQDTSGRITSANPAAQRILGLTLDQLRGGTWLDPHWKIIREDGSPIADEQQPAMLALRSGQPVKNVMMGVRVAERGFVWILLSAMPLFRDGKLNQVYAIFEDVTEWHRMQQQVRQMAFNDLLTQLPNRRLMIDRMGQALTASKRNGCYGALMFLDLDNFKPLNDREGHGAGDLLLIEVARRLKGCVREVDTVARFGGDEFVVMLVDLHTDPAQASAQARIVAEKICASLAEPYVLTLSLDYTGISTVEHHCSASIGVTLFSHQDVSQEAIFRRADMAMYQAKNEGRNTVRFTAAPA